MRGKFDYLKYNLLNNQIILSNDNNVAPLTFKNSTLELSNNIIIQGSLVGLFTGIVGAGGGVLIIPTFVIFAGMNIKIAMELHYLLFL